MSNEWYCPSANLVIELDGGQHYTEEGKASDVLRDDKLRDMGLFVMRFSNLDVLNNMDGVITTIHQYLKTKLAGKETKSP